MLKRIIPLLLFLSLTTQVTGQTGSSAPPEKQLTGKVKGTVDIRQETQRKEDAWAREKVELEARYQAAKAHVEVLERYRAKLEQKDRALSEQVSELERRLEESARLEQGLQEVMESLLQRLEDWVEEDLPFLPEERTLRIRSLRETLALADSTPAEKLRRLLEALQVECEYGDNVEVYQQKISVGGESLFADIFRLGRLSVFWQTPDGSRAGEYDRATGEWVELPSRYRRGIRMAMEMAGRQRSIELVKLPLGRINP